MQDNSRKIPLPLLLKDGAYYRWSFIRFWTYPLAARIKRSPSSVIDENKVPWSRYEILCVIAQVSPLSVSSLMLRLLRVEEEILQPGYSTGASDRYRLSESRTKPCLLQHPLLWLGGRTHHALIIYCFEIHYQPHNCNKT